MPVRVHYKGQPGDMLVTCWRSGIKLLASKAIKIDGHWYHPRWVDKTDRLSPTQGISDGLNVPGHDDASGNRASPSGPAGSTITQYRIHGLREGFWGYRTEEDYPHYNDPGYVDPYKGTSLEGFKGRMMVDDCRTGIYG